MIEVGHGDIVFNVHWARHRWGGRGGRRQLLRWVVGRTLGTRQGTPTTPSQRSHTSAETYEYASCRGAPHVKDVADQNPLLLRLKMAVPQPRTGTKELLPMQTLRME